MRIFLDNCCYGRPYDIQSSERIKSEAEAMVYIQRLITSKKIELATSYILHYENLKKTDIIKRDTIDSFIRKNRSIYIGIENIEKLTEITKEIMSTGIKTNDAYHVASAILANCKYFISVDDRLLKYNSDEIILVNSIEFVKIFGDDKNE